MKAARWWLSRAAALAGVLVLLAIGLNVWLREAERKCGDSGGKWMGNSCAPPLSECQCGKRTLPVGAVFGDGCNVCECEPHGMRCTSKYCFDQPFGCFPGDKEPKPCAGAGCIFDPGCAEPRSFAGPSGVRAARAYCGCDGVTFMATAPWRPYEHVGACPVSPPAPVSPWRPATTALANYRGRSGRGVLWSHGPLLGALDLRTAENALVVSMPRHENVACAAWSDDGSLLGAISSAGSVALWAQDGKLLSDVVGREPVERCSASDVLLAPATQRALAIVGKGVARLVGDGLATSIPVHDEAVPLLPLFSPDGHRVFSEVAEGRIELYDAVTGSWSGQLPGADALAFSADGKYFALSTDDTVSLYAPDSLMPQDIAGSSAAFHLDMLLVQERRDELADQLTKAYSLEPFASRWRRHGISVYATPAAGSGSMFLHGGPFRVGMSMQGYAVFDVRTGATLATWPSSGYACGYQWAWEGGTLVFIEGDQLTFWREEMGAETHRSQCEGALAPIFSADRSRFVGLDGVWDVATRRQLARLAMPHGGGVWGFSRDERLVLGIADVSKELGTAGPVAWDAATGRVVWRGKPHELSDEARHVALPFIDEADGKTFWLSQVIDPAQGPQALVFDDACWAGPAKLPDAVPADLPRRHCPELAATFSAMVRTRGHSPRIE